MGMLLRSGQGRAEGPYPRTRSSADPGSCLWSRGPRAGRRPSDARMRRGASLFGATTCSFGEDTPGARFRLLAAQRGPRYAGPWMQVSGDPPRPKFWNVCSSTFGTDLSDLPCAVQRCAKKGGVTTRRTRLRRRPRCGVSDGSRRRPRAPSPRLPGSPRARPRPLPGTSPTRRGSGTPRSRPGA